MRNAECGVSRAESRGRRFPVQTPHSALRTPQSEVPVSGLPYRVDKPWGYELIWAKTDRYVGKILHIEPGHVLSLQYRSEEHTSELQSLAYLVCRLLLEKKKKKITISCTLIYRCTTTHM